MPAWSSADIGAAVKNKGKTLTGLARECGLTPTACRTAVIHRNIPGERAISELIGVPLWELWPDRWKQPDKPDDAAIRIDGRRKDAAESPQ